MKKSAGAQRSAGLSLLSEVLVHGMENIKGYMRPMRQRIRLP